MKIKKYKCKCWNALYPFGSGAPVCARKYLKTANFHDLLQCTEKGCKYYTESPIVVKEEKGTQK